MNKLRELLAERGKAFDESELRQRVEGYGFNLDSLTDDEAKTVVDELAPQSAMTVANGNGKVPTKSKGKGGRRKALPTIQDAAVHTAGLAEKEITGFSEVLDSNLTAWEGDKADQLLARVRNAPKNVVGKFVEGAMQEVDEADSFRAAAGEFTSQFFPVSQPDAAV